MSECGQTWEVSQILNQASSEKFSCLSHVEPKNLPRPPKQEAMWSGPLSIFAKLYFTSGWSFGSCWSGLSWLGSIAKDLFHWLSSTNFCNSSIYRRDLEKIWLLVIYINQWNLKKKILWNFKIHEIQAGIWQFTLKIYGWFR